MSTTLDFKENKRKNNNEKQNFGNKKKMKKLQKILVLLGRSIITIFITILIIFTTLLLMLNMFCNGSSQRAKELFVTTFLETGQMKFIVSIFLSEQEITEIVNRNSMGNLTAEVDTSLIKTTSANTSNFDINGVKIEEVSGSTFYAKMLIINDPSRVRLATTYPWSEFGLELDKLVNNNNALGGVNGGLYQSDSNKGGKPLGVVVCDGKIQFNNPTGYAGLYLIGFDTSNILRIISIEGMSSNKIEELIKKEKIRDAVTFQDEASDKNNHFVKLIINGQARELNGQGSGANPRTAIGQRADGSVLLLVTDGRGASGHLGATASDLIDVMKQYGAVNAANLDGGSSSSMYYDGKYEMTSVTLYYSNSSWRLPTGFIVDKR
ncbi:MAG TPA: phosphodiester glycosidase family protein [Clostridia bacterium]|nr:phosphodiester glycosidase family protein [Clostridia bacterium]